MKMWSAQRGLKKQVLNLKNANKKGVRGIKEPDLLKPPRGSIGGGGALTDGVKF